MTQAPITICPGCEDATLFAHNFEDDVCEIEVRIQKWLATYHTLAGGNTYSIEDVVRNAIALIESGQVTDAAAALRRLVGDK
jgi:hypothetical protein